ncbi:hypothetical protein GGR52DRAFT_276199 [Hypoxylon sp. FL1284]|nr:hypothetical protein GGR52DRAFT_276199 [Hypoxylon sp. FL1284]
MDPINIRGFLEIRFIKLVDNRLPVVLASWDQDRTQEESDKICGLVDDWDEFVEHACALSLEASRTLPPEKDMDCLYTYLRGLDRADSMARYFKSALEVELRLQNTVILKEGGPYPCDIWYDLPRQYIRSVSSLLHSMGHYRSWIREEIQNIARQRLRPLTVLDLPNELLMKIFGHVRSPLTLDDDPSLLSSCSGGGVSDVQNIRFTC